MDIMKWAVLGSCGIAKRRTIPEGIVAADNAELVAVYDVNTKANEALAEEFGVAAASSEEELLASDADVVYIATPVNLHLQQVLACAEAGKHVICEKPLGMDSGDAMQMIEACEQADVKLAVGFMMRFLALHQAALEIIKDDKLGKPVFGRAMISCWYPPMKGAWRQNPALGGGGSLMDMGGHGINLMEMFFGEVNRVSCFINNCVHDYKSEDSAVATLFFENGAMASIDAFFCIPDASCKTRLELYGSAGSILAEGTLGQSKNGEMTAYLENEGSSHRAQQMHTKGEIISINPEPVNTYWAEVEEFSASILEGREATISAQSALRTQNVLTACYESAKTGKVVEL